MQLLCHQQKGKKEKQKPHLSDKMEDHNYLNLQKIYSRMPQPN